MAFKATEKYFLIEHNVYKKKNFDDIEFLVLSYIITFFTLSF